MPLGEVDKTPVGDEPGKDHTKLYPESSRSLESLREMRLQALLRDMIDAEGGARAGNGARGQLPHAVEGRRVRQAHHPDGRCLGAAAAVGRRVGGCRERERADALERRVKELAKEMHDGLDDAREAIDAGLRVLGEEQAVAVRVLERRLDGLEERVLRRRGESHRQDSSSLACYA